MLRLEAGILLQLVQEASQHEACANQQRAGQAYLAYDQHVAQPAGLLRPSRLRPPLMQALFGIDAGSLQRWRQAK
jgi:hypothetical protein